MADALSAFLTARLNEDEAAANGLFFACRMSGPLRFVSGYGGPAADAFIARHDPARVLRDVEADRRLLAEWQKAEADPAVDDQWNAGLAAGLRLAVQIRAARHSDHPDYRPEWKP